MVRRAAGAPRRPHRGLTVVVIGALGLGLTIGALVLNERRAAHTADVWVDDATGATSDALRSGFQTGEDIVAGLSGFAMSTEDIQRDDFEVYVGRVLSDHPEVVSVQLLDYIQGSQRPRMEAELADLGVPELFERDEFGVLSTAPQRDRYLVVWFESPVFGKTGAAGTNLLDTDSMEATFDEIVRDSSTGIPPSAVLPSGGSGRFGLPVMQPIYDPKLDSDDPQARTEAVQGAANVVIAYSDLLSGALVDVRDEVDVAISDPQITSLDFLAASIGGKTLGASTSPAGSATFDRSEEIDLGPRSLVLNVSARPDAVARLASAPRPWILLTGFLLTAMALGGYLWWSRVRRLERFAKALEDANESLARRSAELKAVVVTDRLTGLPNRQKVHEMAEEALAASTGRSASVVLIDIDRFKDLNDSMGHRRGDELLMMVSRRLAENVRRGSLGRMGGNEFCVVLRDADQDAACVVAERLVSLLRAPFRVGDRVVNLTATAAVCASPSEACDAAEILAHAGLALRVAKAQHRGAWVAFDRDMALRYERRVTIETELRRGLEGDGTPVLTYFQPKVDLSSGRVTSAEALARWSTPELGDVSPEEFIEVAESTGLIVALGEHQIARSLELLERCAELDLALGSISVNASVQQFQDGRLVEVLHDRLRGTGVRADQLVLEITESQAMDHLDQGRSTDQMSRLRQLGVGLSIDDFGTGYSSLSRIETLPVHELKVDRSFITGLPDGASAAGINRAIISMAHTLGMQVVAEGVENAAQRDWLRAAGCDVAQGWFYGKAMDADSFIELLQHQALRRWQSN